MTKIKTDGSRNHTQKVANFVNLLLAKRNETRRRRKTSTQESVKKCIFFLSLFHLLLKVEMNSLELAMTDIEHILNKKLLKFECIFPANEHSKKINDQILHVFLVALEEIVFFITSFIFFSAITGSSNSTSSRAQP